MFLLAHCSFSVSGMPTMSTFTVGVPEDVSAGSIDTTTSCRLILVPPHPTHARHTSPSTPVISLPDSVFIKPLLLDCFPSRPTLRPTPLIVLWSRAGPPP